jgi:hypothetical protein
MRVTDEGVAMGIPSGLSGVLAFIVLLWPGFAYNSARSRRRPDRQLTTLQETAVIVTASLTAVVLTAVPFGIIRAIWPGVTPDLRSLLFRPRPYLQVHYVSTGWWAAAFMAVAILGAVGIAQAQSSARIADVRWLRWLARPPDPSTMSAWWIAFSAHGQGKVEVHVGCTLGDGSYVTGRLHSYSKQGTDAPDRDLVLRAPISVRAAGGRQAQEIQRAALMAISARNIVTMTVTYVRKPVPAASAPAPAPARQPTGSEGPEEFAAADPEPADHGT